MPLSGTQWLWYCLWPCKCRSCFCKAQECVLPCGSSSRDTGNILLQLMASPSCCMVWYRHSGRGLIFPALLFSALLPILLCPSLTTLGWTKVFCSWDGTENAHLKHGARKAMMWAMVHSSTTWHLVAPLVQHAGAAAWKHSTGLKSQGKNPNPHHSLQVNIHCFLCDHLTLPGWSLQSSNAVGSHVWSLLHPSSHPLPPLLRVFFSFLTLLVFCLFSPSIFPSSSRFTSHSAS